MSVYTTVEPVQLELFLSRYALGKPIDFSPIAAGITNTNYYLDTDSGGFILTLYEHHSDDELDYILGLQQHLVKRSVRCSEPQADRRGELFSTLNQRPAAIIKRLPGQVLTAPKLHHCSLIGEELARFHLAGLDYPGLRPNPRGVDWVLPTVDMLDTYLGKEDRLMIRATLLAADEHNLQALPQGAIHADLFHDNALFTDAGLGGILDFDYACNDSFVFDIAVLLNDWCLDHQAELIVDRVDAVLEGYQQHRRLQAIEFDALPILLRFAALRFWLSRLYDANFPLSGELTFIKSPEAYRQMLQLRSSTTREIEKIFLPHRIG